MTNTSTPRRPVRSYVRRRGRMTAAQRRGLECYLPRFGLCCAGRIDLDAAFGRRARRHLEIGFGTGDALISMARLRPEHDFLGIEVYEPGIGRLLHRAASLDLHNVKVLCGDAAEVLAACLADAVLDAVYLFFPDPWPKKRHHKRRLVTPPFVARVCDKLVPRGRFLLATDCEDYAREMLRVLEGEARLTNLAGDGQFAPRPEERPITRFEQRGMRLGHVMHDLRFARRADVQGR